MRRTEQSVIAVAEPHPESLPCKRTFAEETPAIQYADRCFLAGLGENGESHLAGVQIENRSAVSPCVKTFAKSTIFLPSPMVARNVLVSKSRFLLADGTGCMIHLVNRVPERWHGLA